MPVPFPLHYSASLSRTSGARTRIEAPPRPVLCGGSSSALDGDTDASSPEHLFLSSLGLSLLMTFEVFAARDGIELLAWDTRVGGTVDRTPEGLMFTSIVVELDITATDDADRVEATLEDAKHACLVLNSLRIPVVIETQLYAPDEREDLRPGEPSPWMASLPARGAAVQHGPRA